MFHPKKSLLYFVEAKSSTPKDVGLYAKDISKKFIDSFQLLLAGLLKRKTGDEEIGRNIKNIDYSKMNFRFLLIIQDHDELWLPPLKTEIEKNMRGFQNIWNSEVIVMNDDIARKHGMIL